MRCSVSLCVHSASLHLVFSTFAKNLHFVLLFLTGRSFINLIIFPFLLTLSLSLFLSSLLSPLSFIYDMLYTSFTIFFTYKIFWWYLTIIKDNICSWSTSRIFKIKIIQSVFKSDRMSVFHCVCLSASSFSSSAPRGL